MSGGAFDYKNHYIDDFIETLETTIKNNNKKNEYGDITNYSKAIIQQFKMVIKILKVSSIHLHRVDWLLSGDDDEQAYLERLAKDLNDLNIEYQND